MFATGPKGDIKVMVSERNISECQRVGLLLANEAKKVREKIVFVAFKEELILEKYYPVVLEKSLWGEDTRETIKKQGISLMKKLRIRGYSYTSPVMRDLWKGYTKEEFWQRFFMYLFCCYWTAILLCLNFYPEAT